jgi:hypothetical protein
MELSKIKVNHIETKSVMTKSNGPLGGYAVIWSYTLMMISPGEG